MAQRAGLAGKRQESDLESVLGVVLVAEDAAADAEDHRTVAGHQRRKGFLFAQLEEAIEQLTIASITATAHPEQVLKVSQQLAHGRSLGLRLIRLSHLLEGAPAGNKSGFSDERMT
jgi:hypothetical protein